MTTPAMRDAILDLIAEAHANQYKGGNGMSKCELCGEPMPAGEEMFKFHGYSGDCPKQPLPHAIEREVAQAPTAQGEPVAWRYRQRGLNAIFWNDWHAVSYKPQGPESDHFQMEPLYATPPDSAAEIARLTKERDELVFWKGNYERCENATITQQAERIRSLEKDIVIYRNQRDLIRDQWDQSVQSNLGEKLSAANERIKELEEFVKDLRIAGQASGAELADATASLASKDAEFKNFHRVLCERFNYHHDEKDWKRDQVSLVEHIAMATASKDALIDLDKWVLDYQAEKMAKERAEWAQGNIQRLCDEIAVKRDELQEQLAAANEQIKEQQDAIDEYAINLAKEHMALSAATASLASKDAMLQERQNELSWIYNSLKAGVDRDVIQGYVHDAKQLAFEAIEAHKKGEK